VAALAAAVIVATQLPVGHWFYFYIVWFAPFVLIALFAAHVPRADEPEIRVARIEREPEPAVLVG
jgi:hypothetical protein